MRIIITLAFLLAATGVAFPHAHLDHANPPVGSTVAEAPKEVVLTFSNELEAAFSRVDIRDAKGVSVQSGKSNVDKDNRTQLRVPIKPLPPGTYKVIWRVLSVDTHRTQGEFTFRVGP